MLPQAFPQLVAYTLYRWEVNIRASAVLGVVGAGGLGELLHVSLGPVPAPPHPHALLVVVALVTAVDLVSGALRRRILEGGPARGRAPDEAAPPAAPVPGAVEAC